MQSEKMKIINELIDGYAQRKGSYFKRIKHTNLEGIRDYISKFHQIIKEEYFLGIR